MKIRREKAQPEPDPEPEIWKVYPNNQNYEVSTLGRIRRAIGVAGARKGKILKPQRINCGSAEGYLFVHLYSSGRSKGLYIHRLVMETFQGIRPDGKECCHRNGVRSDNRLSNLYWGTRSDNIRDAYRHGTFHQGFKPGYEVTDNMRRARSKVMREYNENRKKPKQIQSS